MVTVDEINTVLNESWWVLVVIVSTTIYLSWYWSLTLAEKKKLLAKGKKATIIASEYFAIAGVGLIAFSLVMFLIAANFILIGSGLYVAGRWFIDGVDITGFWAFFSLGYTVFWVYTSASK